MGSSPTRGSSFFLGKVTTLGVLCCFALFVCLTVLASFFHLFSSLIKKHVLVTVARCILWESFNEGCKQEAVKLRGEAIGYDHIDSLRTQMDKLWTRVRNK